MIQAAATSLPSSLALGTGAQSASGDDPASSGAFAKVLSSSMAPGQDCPGDATAASGLAASPDATQTSGKTAGKILPDLTGIAASAETAADTPAAGEPAPVLQRVTGEIILPGLVLPVSAKPAQSARPEAKPSTSESLARTAAAQLKRASQSAAIAGAPAPKPPKGSDKTDENSSAMDEGTSTATFATAPADPLQLVIQVAIPVSTQTVEADAQTLPALAQPGATPARPLVAPVSGQEQLPPEEAAASTASVPTPAVQTAPAADAVSVVVSFALPQSPAAQAMTPVQPTVQQLAALQPAAPRPTAPRPTTPRPTTPANAQAQATPVKPNTTINPAAPATKKAMAAAGADVPADVPQAAPAADGAQPTPTTDGAPCAPAANAQALPIVADTSTLTQTVAPVAVAPATGTTQLSSHDFATLVDRLVEAREAASPQTVHAAISHSEFGQVSLRFDQDASGLSVSMTSADPEFARAVQASAASAGSQTPSDNGSAPRQDAPAHHQQHSAGSSSGQPQSQPQSQAYGRESRAPQARTQARSAARQNPETDRSQTGGDIYA
jgi:hypothetical protein